MKKDDAMGIAIVFFAIILGGSLLSALAGGAFGAVVALISPEFVAGLFFLEEGTGVVRLAIAVGMVWGLFIGAAVSGFACALSAVIRILRIRYDNRQTRPSQGD